MSVLKILHHLIDLLRKFQGKLYNTSDEKKWIEALYKSMAQIFWRNYN